MALEEGGAVTADSRGTTISSGSGTAKGSYVELIASSGIACEWMVIQIMSSQDSSVSDFNLDIATGAAASEVVVVPDILGFMKNATPTQRNLLVPIQISSSTRISARLATASAGVDTIDLSVYLISDSSFGTNTNIDSIGTGSGTGTTIDPGASANTKGSWVELVASSANEYDYVVVMCSENNNANQTSQDRLVDIATGAAASEVVLIPDIHYPSDVFEINGQAYTGFIINVPASTRISARAQSTIIDATDRLLDVGLLGCELTAPAGGSGGGLKLAGRGGLAG